MCPLWQVSPTSTPCTVLAWVCGHRGPQDSSSELAHLLGNRQALESIHSSSRPPHLGPQSMLMGLGKHLPLLLRLTFTPTSLDRTGRQTPTRLSRNPEAGWLLGRKRSKEVALKFTLGPVSSLWPLQNSQLARSSAESAAMAWSTMGRRIVQG